MPPPAVDRGRGGAPARARRPAAHHGRRNHCRRRCRSRHRLVGRTCAAAPPPPPRRLTRRRAASPRRLAGRRRYYNLPASLRERPSARRDGNEQEGAAPKLFVVKELGLVSSVPPTPTTTGRSRCRRRTWRPTRAAPQTSAPLPSVRTATDAWVGEGSPSAARLPRTHAPPVRRAARPPARPPARDQRSHPPPLRPPQALRGGGLLQALHRPGFRRATPTTRSKSSSCCAPPTASPPARTPWRRDALPPDVEEEGDGAALSFLRRRGRGGVLRARANRKPQAAGSWSLKT